MQEHDLSREENVPFYSLPRVQQTPEGRTADSGAYVELCSVLSSRDLSCKNDVYSRAWYHRIAWKLRTDSLNVFTGKERHGSGIPASGSGIYGGTGTGWLGADPSKTRHDIRVWARCRGRQDRN